MRVTGCNLRSVLVLPAMFALAFGATAYGQNNVAGNTALENARASAARGRAPGIMVSAGVVRAQTAANFARAGIEITETSRPTSWRTEFLVDAIEIVFEQLNQAIALFSNLLILRAGGEPEIPADLSPDTSQNDGSNDSRQPPSGRK